MADRGKVKGKYFLEQVHTDKLTGVETSWANAELYLDHYTVDHRV